MQRPALGSYTTPRDANEVAEALRFQSSYTIAEATRRLMGFKSAKDEKHYFDGLSKAGVPDKP